jgi:hypothetical protein
MVDAIVKHFYGSFFVSGIGVIRPFDEVGFRFGDIVEVAKQNIGKL